MPVCVISHRSRSVIPLTVSCYLLALIRVVLDAPVVFDSNFFSFI